MKGCPMNVSEIMTTDVACCGADESMEVAARRMWDRDCGCVPVLRDGVVAGMITDRDICMAALTQGQPLAKMTVGSAMSSNAWTCRPSDSLEDAERVMQERQVRRLPVVGPKGEIVGILSLNDLARAASMQREQRRPAITVDEVAWTLASTCQPHATRVASA